MKIIVVFIISILLTVGVMYGILMYMGYSVSGILLFMVREFLLCVFIATLIAMGVTIYEIHYDRLIGHSSLILGVLIITLVMGWGTYIYATQGRMLKNPIVVPVKDIPFKTIIRLPIMDTEGTSTYGLAYIWKNTKSGDTYKISRMNDSIIPDSNIDISKVHDETDIVTQYYKNTDTFWDFYWYTILSKTFLSSDKAYKNTVHYFVLLFVISLSMTSGLFLVKLFTHPIITAGFIFQWYIGISILSSHINKNLIALEALLFITFFTGYCMYRITRYNNKHDVLEGVHDNFSLKDIENNHSIGV